MVESNRDLVFEAFNNPNFKYWRTIMGIANEASLSEDEVREVIKSSQDSFVLGFRTVRDKNITHSLYALRERYEKQVPFFHKLISAVVDRPY